MGEENFEMVKDLMQEMVDKMALYNDQSRVAIITYSDGPKVTCLLCKEIIRLF